MQIQETRTISQIEELGHRYINKIRNCHSPQSLTGVFAELFAEPVFERINKDDISKKERKQIRTEIRIVFQDLFKESGIWSHSLNKPYGYPGDFAILEHVYENKVHSNSQGALGGLVDKWSINLPLPTAVSARKDVLNHYLTATIKNFNGKTSVLSVGCGAAREVRELPSNALKKLDLTLLDLDSTGIDYAINVLESTPETLSVKKVIADAIVDDLLIKLPNQQFDIVYSFGIVDYLTDRHAIPLINNMKKVTNKTGKLLFCIKDASKYDGTFYDIFLDWRFVKRTHQDGLALAEKCGLKVERAMKVSEGLIVIYECSIL